MQQLDELENRAEAVNHKVIALQDLIQKLDLYSDIEWLRFSSRLLMETGEAYSTSKTRLTAQTITDLANFLENNLKLCSK